MAWVRSSLRMRTRRGGWGASSVVEWKGMADHDSTTRRGIMDTIIRGKD